MRLACNRSLSAAGSDFAIRMEQGADFFGSVDLASLGFCHAFGEPLVDRVLVAEQPSLLRLKQVECAVDEFVRLAIRTASDLTLDTLLGGGIEGDAHEESIAQRCHLKPPS